jgi:hypothetical protein
MSFERRRSLPPRSFSELEVSDLEAMLAPHSPSLRKSSLQNSEISLLNNFDLEAMIPKNHYVRRCSNQYQEIPVSDRQTLFDNKFGNNQIEDFALSPETKGRRRSILP